jgi:hypothetical protein
MPQKSSYDLFTTFRVHGLVRDPNGESVPLSLDRSSSFPSPAWTLGEPGEPFSQSFAPRAIPTTGYTLEARISPRKSTKFSMITGQRPDGFLGDGRSAFVYSLDVIGIHHSACASGEEPLPTDNTLIHSLPPLCVKVAQPTYARSVAREAWFYEKLADVKLTGVLAPLCYGLFCGGPYNRPPDPNSQYSGHEASSFGCLDLNLPKYDFLLDENFTANPRGAALLPEESGSYTCQDDDLSSSTSSPWFTFRETKDTLSLAVLLLEELPGETLREVDDEKEL